jgi:hypothetical protein
VQVPAPRSRMPGGTYEHFPIALVRAPILWLEADRMHALARQIGLPRVNRASARHCL